MTLPRDGQENRRCLHNIKTTSRTQEGGYVEGGSQSIHQPRIEVSAKVERKEREKEKRGQYRKEKEIVREQPAAGQRVNGKDCSLAFVLSGTWRER